MTRLILLLTIWIAAAAHMIAQPDLNDRRFAFSAGMGIGAFAAPSVADYMNIVAQPSYDRRVEDFSSMTEFFAVPEYRVANDWWVGAEYAYAVKSFVVDGIGGSSQFTYTVHLPGAVVRYMIPGEGYMLRFGGGLGYAYGAFSEALYGSQQFTRYTARALSVKMEAMGNTKFDDGFYGLIAVDARWVIGGSFKNGSLVAAYGSTRAELNYFIIGLKLGFMFLW